MSWLGPLVFGLAYQLTGSYRDAIISLVVFFVLGFVLLARVPVGGRSAAAGNPVTGPDLDVKCKGAVVYAFGPPGRTVTARRKMRNAG